MTVKIKVLPRTTVKLKGATRLVGQITAGTGITVVDSAGIWTISVNTTTSSIVTGPASAVDNAVARFDGTDGTVLQNSAMIVSDAGVVTGVTFDAGLITGVVPIATGGTGQITANAGFNALAPTTTRGDLIARSATVNARLGIGTAGYALISDGTDPAWTGFLQSGTGAVTRTWQDKARDIVHAADWGVSAAASAAANTTALNLFFTHVRDNQLHGILPAGSIQHTGLTITGNGNSIVISGAGTRATILMNTSTTSNDLTIDTAAAGINNLQIRNILFDSLATKTAGYGIKQTGDNPISSASVFDNLFFSTKTFGGIHLECFQAGGTISNITIMNVGQNARGIALNGAVTNTINTFLFQNIKILNGVGGAGTTTTGLWLGDYCSGHFADIKVQGGVGGMTNGIWLAGANNNNCYFTRAYADVCNRGIIINGGNDLNFKQGAVQFSVTAPVSEGDGIVITGGNGITFDGFEIVDNQKRGFNITGGSSIRISDCTIDGNGYVPTPGSFPGILVADGVNDFALIGNTFFFTGSANRNGGDIVIAGPNNDRYVIMGNVCRATTGIQDNGTGRDKQVAFNAGTTNPNGNVISDPLALLGSSSGLASIIHVSGTPTLTVPATTTTLTGNAIANPFTAANTFTLADAAAITVLSGNAGAYGRLDIGRTAADVNIAVAGGADQFITGTVAGDTAINAASALWLGRGTVAGIRVGTSGALRFSALGAGLAHLDSSGNVTSSSGVNADMANMADSTIKGRAVGAGSGAQTDLTAAQAAAVIGNVGGALKSKIITITRDLTVATGSVAYTGVGFTPTSMIAIGTVTLSNTQYFVINAIADSSRTAMNVFLGSGSHDVQGATFLIFMDAAGTANQAATITSYDADGFTLSWVKTGTPTGTATIRVLCFR